MIRTKQEVINQINRDFKSLITELPNRSVELQAKQRNIEKELNQIENLTLNNIRKICSSYIPEEANTLLENMHDTGLSTEGVQTEEQVSTLLACLLTPTLNFSQEDIEYYNSLPENTTVNFLNHIGIDNVIHMQTQNGILFAAREEAIDELLAQIPPNPSAGYFTYLEY